MKRGSVIRTSRLLLRDWRDEDVAAFQRLSQDEDVMRFFPYRRDRAESIEAMQRIAVRGEADGYGWCAAELAETGEVVGITGFAVVEAGSGLPGDNEIGWRFLPEHWGRGLASEAASALLDHAFGDIGLSEMVAFAVHDNHASTSVMRKIGMQPDPAASFDHPRVPDTHKHLRHHVTWRINADQWRRLRAAT